MNPFEGYRITSPYGMRTDPFPPYPQKMHTGIDLVLADKAPLKAFMPGKVVHAKEGVTGSGFGGFGNVVALLDDHGAIQFYAHLSSISVKVGDIVKAGQVIGTQGNTGHSAGSHLHFEVRLNGKSSGFGYESNVEPTAYLQKYMKEESEMSKDEGMKIITSLGKLYALTKDKAEKAEVHRQANAIRTIIGIPLQ
ncbi:M23 family metallopeptidase [Paenibacillus psychroresistens]|uniref:M23 family metallopeptidase n=1 Tax=Paenibacillus psychroresistens TaxID=1778678 RepID=A0A6B8RNC0_9BACL|nr:M23 family metallopeptidase [Paenibacillus psychroresistens]QGQ97045.1 M23 family metallopeptidase [Paenibacillus psychroresistens]